MGLWFADPPSEYVVKIRFAITRIESRNFELLNDLLAPLLAKNIRLYHPVMRKTPLGYLPSDSGSPPT
jgi:hypothetical protein